MYPRRATSEFLIWNIIFCDMRKSNNQRVTWNIDSTKSCRTPWFFTYMKPVFYSAQRSLAHCLFVRTIEDINHGYFVKVSGFRAQLVVQSPSRSLGMITPLFEVSAGATMWVSS